MTTNYIYKEIPTWLVNWVNKVFYTAFNISVLAEFFIGWVPYRSITSVATNTIVLNEAPPTWADISVDYYKI
jgi:hypothetical protein